MINFSKLVTTNRKEINMKQLLNILLLISFLGTVLVPITGLHIHKLASLLFLLLCIIHTVIYWKKMNAKRFAALAMVIVSFISGIFGMILDHIPMVLALHKAVSILMIFPLAIHIFIFHKKLHRS